MNFLRCIVCAITGLLLLPVAGTATSKYFKFAGIYIQLADSADASGFLSLEDEYLNYLSDFDMHGRFRDNEKHSVTDYLNLAAQQARNWSSDEQEVIKYGFKKLEDIANKLSLKLNLPDTIVFIQSTTKEEFGAGGYTRRNGIIINQDEVVTPALIAHELFHVLSRHNPDLRDELYNNIGFKKCNKIDIRNAMNGLNITNPDCPGLSHYITINNKDYILVLHSKKQYEGGNVFAEDYIAVSLVELTGSNNNKKPLLNNGAAVSYSIDQKPEILNIIGTNTDYLLHPEEICAEHFAALVTERVVPEPKFLDKMKDDLQ